MEISLPSLPAAAVAGLRWFQTLGGQTVDGTVQAIAGASGQGVACGFVADPLFLTDPETG